MESSVGEETRVLIAHVPSGGNGEVRENLKLEGSLMRLRHPRTGKPTSYGYFGGTLQEFHWFKECYGSWFLGNYVCEDGGFYASTPVDPVFLMLPIFEEARMKKGDDNGKFRDLDEILLVDGYPEYSYLTAIAETSMAAVCEVKEFEASKFYRLSDNMVLSWLCQKVEQTKLALQNMDKNYASQDEKNTLTDAISLLGEYMNEEPWLKLVCDHLGLSMKEATSKAPLLETIVSNVESSPNSFQPTPMKNSGAKNEPSTRRQSKRLKPETSSLNIKDMFSKASKPRS